MRVLLFVFFAVTTGAYKILVYSPKFAHSHSNFMGRIADTLASAGHNVVYDSDTVRCPWYRRWNERESTVVHVVPDDETTAAFDRTFNAQFDPWEGSNFDPISSFMVNREHPYIADYFIEQTDRDILREYGNCQHDTNSPSMMDALPDRTRLWRNFARMCHITINKPGLMDRLRADAYDVFIAEQFDVCGLGIVPYISPKSAVLVSSSVLSSAMYSDLGILKSISYNPFFFMTSFDPHSMLDRFWNIVSEAISSTAFPRSALEAVLRQRFGPSHPSISQGKILDRRAEFQTICSHAAVVFTNGEPLLNIAAPTLHKVVDIAGLGAIEPKALDKKWLEILELRFRTVLISFGSVAKSSKLKPEAKRAILETVAHFPEITFVWKYETTDDDFAKMEASKLPNLILSTWTPQNDLLKHTRLAAFVTHGGMGSVQETARRGVPAIILPLFGDQPRNALMLKERALGKVLEKQNIRDSTKIIAALDEILSDESYRLRAREMARKLSSKPFSAKELLVKHVEFAAEFGPSSALRPTSIDMSFVELYNLDLLLITSIVIAGALFLVLRLVQLVFRRVILKSKLE